MRTDTMSKNIAPDWGTRYGITELWSQITPGLYVGGTDDADVVGNAVLWETRVGRPVRPSHAEAFITPEDFDAVVTLYAYARPVGWEVEELRWGIYDDRDSDFDPDLVALNETVAWAHRRWKAGKRVLIRCQAGLNRSSLIAALVLVQDGMPPQDAIDKIRRGRSHKALFNKQFVKFIHAQAALPSSE